MSLDRQASPLPPPSASYPQTSASGGLVELLLRSESAARRLERELRSAIVRLELPPGTRLTEQDIASRYGVSRQPVREAFISLDRAGLLSVRAQRGTLVVRISRERMKAARFVREAVEIAVARRACIEFDRAARNEIEDLLDLQKRVADRGDRDGFTPVDEAFHQALARGCGMPSVWDALADIKSHMDRVCHLTIPDADSMQPLVDQHRAIVTAIDAKDADAAEAAMRYHLTEILRAMPRAEAANPDLFE
jgi:GntR family transcriptional regulator, rspAB operon transcriptional repressor